jgi:hypothetical protein
MKSGIKFLLTVVILIFFIVTPALADTVVLKNGRELKVEKTWQEGDQLCFIFHGMKAGIPQKKVIRIESDSKNQNKMVAKRVDRRPQKDVSRAQLNQKTQKASTSRQVVSPTKLLRVLRNDGFGDLTWGVEVSEVDGLEKKEVTRGFDDVIEYVRSQDILKIGDAALSSIIYSFWRNRLYMVTIWTEEYSNYTALCDKVFKQFGPGHQIEPPREMYLWSGTPSDMMLEYINGSRHGMLWLRSKEMDRQRRSSQLKSHASYLKWMRSKQ